MSIRVVSIVVYDHVISRRFISMVFLIIANAIRTLLDISSLE